MRRYEFGVPCGNCSQGNKSLFWDRLSRIIAIFHSIIYSATELLWKSYIWVSCTLPCVCVCFWLKPCICSVALVRFWAGWLLFIIPVHFSFPIAVCLAIVAVTVAVTVAVAAVAAAAAAAFMSCNCTCNVQHTHTAIHMQSNWCGAPAQPFVSLDFHLAQLKFTKWYKFKLTLCALRFDSNWPFPFNYNLLLLLVLFRPRKCDAFCAKWALAWLNASLFACCVDWISRPNYRVSTANRTLKITSKRTRWSQQKHCAITIRLHVKHSFCSVFFPCAHRIAHKLCVCVKHYNLSLVVYYRQLFRPHEQNGCFLLSCYTYIYSWYRCALAHTHAHISPVFFDFISGWLRPNWQSSTTKGYANQCSN